MLSRLKSWLIRHQDEALSWQHYLGCWDLLLSVCSELLGYPTGQLGVKKVSPHSLWYCKLGRWYLLFHKLPESPLYNRILNTTDPIIQRWWRWAGLGKLSLYLFRFSSKSLDLHEKMNSSNLMHFSTAYALSAWLPTHGLYWQYLAMKEWVVYLWHVFLYLSMESSQNQ